MLNFIYDNRLAIFLNRLADVSKSQSDISYIDLSPDNLFDGEIGTILVKNGSDILFKENADSVYTNLSTLVPYLINPLKYALERGVNKNVTWIKNSSTSHKTWKFLGYKTPFDGPCDACAAPVLYVT